MTGNPTVLTVVAAALLDGEGKVCFQQRPHGKNHGGLWEFPGGKVERGESPESALVRELDEELGITVDRGALVPAGFAAAEGIVILLYACRRWTGTPRCIEGEAIGWYNLKAAAALAMPPLDYPLAAQLDKLLRSGAI